MKKITKYIKKIIKEEKYIMTFIIILFFIGLIFGSLFINFMSKSDKNLLLGEVSNYIKNVKHLTNEVFSFKAVLSYFLNHFLIVTLIFIFGLSIIGGIVVIFIIFFKGFIYGTTLSVIIYNYKLKGIFWALLYFFPACVVEVVSYFLISFFAFSTTIKIIKAIKNKTYLDFKKFLGKYVLSYITCVVLIIFSSLCYIYITTLLLKLYSMII